MRKAPDMIAANDIILTANRLDDGAVLWMTADLGWTTDRSKAAHFDAQTAPEAAAHAEEDAKANQIVSVYSITVDGKADRSARESIRAAKGPSIIPPADKLSRPCVSVTIPVHSVVKRVQYVSLRSA